MKLVNVARMLAAGGLALAASAYAAGPAGTSAGTYEVQTPMSANDSGPQKAADQLQYRPAARAQAPAGSGATHSEAHRHLKQSGDGSASGRVSGPFPASANDD